MIEQSSIAILDGDQVTGRALEVLLQDARYKSKYVTNIEPGGLEEMLVGVGLVILFGGYDGQEEALPRELVSTSTGLGLPVLKLVTVFEEKAEDLVRLVFWPCPIEDLKQEIEAALDMRAGFEGRG